MSTKTDKPKKQSKAKEKEIVVAKDERTKLYLYSTDCLNCYHLCSHADAKAYTSCHISKGNEYCPAGSIVFKIGGNYKTIAKNIVKSMRDNDLPALTRKMNRLKRKDKEEQVEIMRLVNELLDKQKDH